MNAKDLIDLFYDEARSLRNDGAYEKAQAVEQIGSWVNNVFHGKHPKQYVPEVIDLVESVLRWDLSDEEREGYLYGKEFLDMLLEDLTN